MGCGASAESLKRDLENSRHEVGELQKQLKESELNRDELQRQFQKASPSVESPESPARKADVEAAASPVKAEAKEPDSPSKVPPVLVELQVEEAAANALTPPPGLAEPSGEKEGEKVLAAEEKKAVDEAAEEETPKEKAEKAEDQKQAASERAGAGEEGAKEAPEKSVAVDVSEVELPGVVVHEGDASEAKKSNLTPADDKENKDPSAAPVPSKAAEEKKEEEEAPSKKPASSLDSTASTTCTPNAQAAKASAVSTCGQCFCETDRLFLDPTDLNRYCESCWIEYYGQAPSRTETNPLVCVEVSELWCEDLLAQAWAERILPGWPPPLAHSGYTFNDEEEEQFTTVQVRLRRDICGPHAREQTNSSRPHSGDILAKRYRMSHMVGEGHFTKAFLAHDLKEDKPVCVKRHRSLPVEGLADLFVLGKRLEEVDEGGEAFPKLIDAFYDVVGFTVESLIEGQNCLSKAQSNRDFFQDLSNLRTVAVGALSGLVLLDQAGVVHNDVKPDNLIWTEGDGSSSSSSGPRVKIVDFGCARLDQREENGRNWALAEGGAGHLGKWAPEMTLRLAIGHRGDIWGVAISLCELFCNRMVWRSEADTAEVVMAQALGLCNLRDGIPASLLRRSPLDVRQLYSPAPRHWPLRRNGRGQMEALRPTRWGLDQVLGQGWQDSDKVELGQLLLAALVIDPAFRPSASQLLKCCSFVGTQSPDDSEEVDVPAS